MNAREKVGQLFFIGFPGTEMTPALRDYVDEIRPGGVIAFARNIVDAEQLRALNEAISGIVDPPPFIAVDQEGGRVSRLRALLPPLPTGAMLGTWDTDRIRDYAATLGRALTALGFNTDFAPVVDLSTPGAVNGIGDRSFGEDARLVSHCARAFSEGLEAAGVAAFLKHFPGLGATDLDSHVGLPVCRRDAREMWERDLLPFRECADAVAGFMIAHVHCPAFDPGASVPASLSEAVIGGLLRRRLGYDGLSLTDDLEMGAVVGAPPAELARTCLVAGNDMVMFCNSPESALAAARGILRDVESGALSAARIERSVQRVLRAKQRYPSLARGATPPAPSWASALQDLAGYAVV